MEKKLVKKLFSTLPSKLFCLFTKIDLTHSIERMRNLIYKSRVEPSQLVILKILSQRMQLSKTDHQQYLNLKKGYEGELLFDLLTQNLKCDCLVLNDLRLKSNNQTLQIDSLIIMNHGIHIFEIKNYSGDFYYESDRLFQKDRSEISNPLIQLQRTESLLRQLLLKLNSSIPIQSSVVFISHDFTLYQAPLNKPFIFPTQLKYFMNNLNIQQTKLNEQHRRLAEKLLSLHIEEYHHLKLPPYNFQQLRMGTTCSACASFSIIIYGKVYNCTECGNEELVESAVVRNIKEFMLLFPEEKVTTNQIYEWCNNIASKKSIQRILDKNFHKSSVHRWTYYS